MPAASRKSFRSRLEIDADKSPLYRRRASAHRKVMIDRRKRSRRREDLRPNLAVSLVRAVAVALISTMSLPCRSQSLRPYLGALMIAGAEVDARTYLLPDTVPGRHRFGVLAAPALNPFEPWLSAGTAVVRAAGTAFALVLLRWGYGWLRSREVLASANVTASLRRSALGSRLASIPFCFALATCSALVTVMLRRLAVRGSTGQRSCRSAHSCAPLCGLVFYVCERHPDRPLQLGQLARLLRLEAARPIARSHARSSLRRVKSQSKLNRVVPLSLP